MTRQYFLSGRTQQMSFPERVAGVTSELQQSNSVLPSGRQQSLSSGMPQLSWSSHNIILMSVFAWKKTQISRTLISFWIGAAASNKKHKGEKLLRNKTATSESLWQEEDSYWVCFLFGRDIEWFIHPSVFSSCFSSFLSHFFSLFLVLSSFVFLPDPHRRSLSTTLAGRIWDCQRGAPAVSPHTHGCPSSY